MILRWSLPIRTILSRFSATLPARTAFISQLFLAFAVAPAAALSHRVTAVLMFVAAAAAVPLVVSARLTRADVHAIGLLIALLVWMVATLWWSAAPVHTMRFIPDTALTVISCWLLCLAAQRIELCRLGSFALALTAGVLIAVAYLYFEFRTEGWLTRKLHPGRIWYNPLKGGEVVLVMVLWPAVCLAWKRFHPLAGWALIAFVAVPVHALFSRAALLALVVAGLVFCLGLPLGRYLARAMSCAFVLYVLAWPAFAPYLYKLLIVERVLPIPEAELYRVMVWRLMAEHVYERPLLGWGANSARELPGIEIVIAGFPPSTPLHPHNMPLQWWIELGLPGVAALLVLLTPLIWRVGDLQHRVNRAAALAMSASILTLGSLTFGAWQTWWVAVIATMIALMIIAVRDDTKTAGE